MKTKKHGVAFSIYAFLMFWPAVLMGIFFEGLAQGFGCGRDMFRRWVVGRFGE